MYRLMRVLRTLDHGPKFRYHPGKRLKEYTLQDLMFVKTLPPVLTLLYLDCHSPSRQILHLIPVIHQTFLTPTFNKGANSWKHSNCGVHPPTLSLTLSHMNRTVTVIFGVYCVTKCMFVCEYMCSLNCKQ